MNFFSQTPQRRGGSSTTSEADMSTMDDVQFSASLDALLNGEQLQVSPATTNNTGLSGPYLVVTGVALPSAAANGQPSNSKQQQQQLPPGSIGGPGPLAGLALASANQGALTLQPPDPHSAAQLSLSVGHAAATGGFHPTGLATAQLQFPWTPTINNAATSNSLTQLAQHRPLAPQPPPQHAQQQHGGAGMAPLAAASINAGAADPSDVMSGGKRSRSSFSLSASAVSEDEGERERRRHERNLREQQRSHKITEQITNLREVLSEANVPFKPDKYSTLTKVVDYIKQLQERSQVLDGEHRKLLETISKTNEIVNNQYVPAYASGANPPVTSRNHSDLLGSSALSNSSSGDHHHHHHQRHHNLRDDNTAREDDSSLSHIRGIDYKFVFMGCGIPQALASIDGRFLDCNTAFLELTGYTRLELLPLEKDASFSPPPPGGDDRKKNLSLFNLLSRDGMEIVFVAMSEMLKHQAGEAVSSSKKNNNKSGNGGSSNSGSHNSSSISMDASTADHNKQWTGMKPTELVDFWSGPVKLCRQQDLPVKLNVTLVRTSRGRPKFFNCALTALDDSTSGGGGRGDDSTLNSVQSLSTTQERATANPENAAPPQLPTSHQEND